MERRHKLDAILGLEERIVEEGRERLVLQAWNESRRAVRRLDEDASLLREIHEMFSTLSDDELLVFVYSVYV